MVPQEPEMAATVMGPVAKDELAHRKPGMVDVCHRL
jgi:hypothetical protein